MSAPIDPFLRKQPWILRGHDIATRRPLCSCGCGQVVGKGRSSSAGPECVKAWKAHSDFNHIRWLVEHRDKGQCALCAVNAVKLSNRYQNALHRATGSAYCWSPSGAEYDRRCRRLLAWRLRAGFPSVNRRWWEMDHIVPVVEGGGGCDFNGYRTLCVPCHRRETKALAGRRASGRRPAPQPELNL